MPVNHALKALALALSMLAALPAAAQDFAGTWLFDDAPSYPGVTMMQLATREGHVTGTVTTAWYGPMEMLNPAIEGDTIRFEMRTLNDREHKTRRWTAKITGDAIKLEGDIWSTRAEQTGRRGTPADAAQRTFRVMPLPPLGGPIPTNLAKTPPMGWSSWNKFAEHIDDRTIREIADAMVSTGLRDAGYRYVNIDDGWQGTRGKDGRIRPNAKFPDMKALADYVHSKGLKLGIYSSQGPKTCAGYEGSYGHVAQDAQTFADWGIDYLKYDLCSGEWFYDTRDTVMRSYYEMAAALQATGREILFSLCEYGRFDVGSWGRDVGGSLWRTTGDITDDYPTMARIGFDKNGNAAHAGPGGWNDPDMLEIGNGGMSDDEYATHMTLWAMSAAPLMMGHDVRKTDPHALQLLTHKALIAIDQDSLGVQGKAVRKTDGAEIWTKRLADGGVAVALFNRGDAPRAIHWEPADAGLDTVSSIHDVWRGTDRDASDRVAEVPAHGVALFVVRS